MDVVRTPDARFADLPGYPFAPHYLEVPRGEGEAGTLRMHYLDEGDAAAPPVLLLHGEPTWSYLYRKMVPTLVKAGFRVVAPDLVGFGRSDKPTRIADYSYARHVAWVTAFVEALELQRVLLVCQDWGSLIGLRIAGEHPDRFARIVVANGFLPTARQPVPPAFRLWRAFATYSPIFPVGRIVASGCVGKLTPAERRAYDAPFPSRAFTAGARAFPALVPIRADDPAVPANRAAWDSLGRFSKPFLTLFGKNDPILGRADAALQRHVAGADGQPHERFWGGHFVQEDRGDHLATTIARWAGGATA